MAWKTGKRLPLARADLEAITVISPSGELSLAAGARGGAVVLAGSTAEDGAAVSARSGAFRTAVRAVGAAVDFAGIDGGEATTALTEVGVLVVEPV